MNRDRLSPPRRRWWVRFYWQECVLCGKTNNSRERVYYDVEPKPAAFEKRHIIGPTWACEGHF
jgi:hypothetical protein